MKFYKITFKSVPEIVFAHKYHTSSYSLSPGKLPHAQRFEITYVEYGDLEFDTDSGTKITFAEKTVNTNIYDQAMRGTSFGRPHSHITVGISGLFDIEVLDNLELLKDAGKSTNLIIIPQTVPADESSKCKKSISSIIYNYTSGSPLKATSSLFELFSSLTDFSLGYERAKLGISNSDDLYCKKIKDYISEHIYERISLADIAAHLDMSEAYICRIFKKATGSSIINFINKTKIDIATDMLLTKKITTSELAFQLGIDDEKYFCRLFKLYTGKSVSEYK